MFCKKKSFVFFAENYTTVLVRVLLLVWMVLRSFLLSVLDVFKKKHFRLNVGFLNYFSLVCLLNVHGLSSVQSIVLYYVSRIIIPKWVTEISGFFRKIAFSKSMWAYNDNQIIVWQFFTPYEVGLSRNREGELRAINSIFFWKILIIHN